MSFPVPLPLPLWSIDAGVLLALGVWFVYELFAPGLATTAPRASSLREGVRRRRIPTGARLPLPARDVFRKGIANYSVFDTQIEEIRLRGNVAVVMRSETVEPVGDAPHAGKTVNRRYRHVWRQEDGRWRLFARYAHIVSVE